MIRPRVLVIDDEESIRFTIQEYLRLYRYEVVTADNPMICPALREDRPCERGEPCTDIVLIDLHMPLADGLAFLESRRRYGCPNLLRRMALMTGNLSQEAADRLRQTGAGCFQKPVPLAEIRAWIERVMEE